MFLSFVAAAVLVGTGFARPEYQQAIPNGRAGSDPSSGISCSPLGHDGCVEGATRNAFGLAFQAAGFKWTKELCEADSDGDGESNGSELGDPCCLWSPTNTNPKGFRVTNLSHPGDASEDGSKVAPKCEESSGEAEVTEAPAVVTEAPVETTEAPAVVTESPVTTTQAPAATTESPKETTEAPAVVTEAPADVTTSAPEIETEAPVDATTTTPIVVTYETVEGITLAPAVVTEAPVDATTMAEAAVTDAPMEATTTAPDVATEAPAVVTTKKMKTESEMDVCSESNTSCTNDSTCCEPSDQCTDAPWEGAEAKLCLLKPPVCYKDGERCAGAAGYEFVPYAACCDSAQDCVEDEEMGWGRFCISAPAGYYDGSAGEGGRAYAPTAVTEAPIKTTVYPVDTDYTSDDEPVETTDYSSEDNTGEPVMPYDVEEVYDEDEVYDDDGNVYVGEDLTLPY